MSRWIIKGKTNSSLVFNIIQKRGKSEGLYVAGKTKSRELSDIEKNSISTLDAAIGMKLIELIEIPDLVIEETKIESIIDSSEFDIETHSTSIMGEDLKIVREGLIKTLQVSQSISE